MVPEDGGRSKEVGSGKAEVGKWKKGVRWQVSDVEGGGQMTEDG